MALTFFLDTAYVLALLLNPHDDYHKHVKVVSVDTALLRRAIDFYQSREDKEWGLTDCISFIVREDNGLTDALTTDEHFQQAGFRALLRE
jgi:predicted nucleic acid-binding protein